MPDRIVLDGVTVDDAALPQDTVTAILPSYDPAFAPDKPYPYGTPRQVSASVCSVSGKPVTVCEHPIQYPTLADWHIEG